MRIRDKKGELLEMLLGPHLQSSKQKYQHPSTPEAEIRTQENAARKDLTTSNVRSV
jgi:hypothetical protein